MTAKKLSVVFDGFRIRLTSIAFFGNVQQFLSILSQQHEVKECSGHGEYDHERWPNDHPFRFPTIFKDLFGLKSPAFTFLFLGRQRWSVLYPGSRIPECIRLLKLVDSEILNGTQWFGDSGQVNNVFNILDHIDLRECHHFDGFRLGFVQKPLGLGSSQFPFFNEVLCHPIRGNRLSRA